MSEIKINKRLKIKRNGHDIELRIKGDWYWAHLYLPIFAWAANIFHKGYRKNFMERFLTVSTFVKNIIYVSTITKRITDISLEHELVHIRQMGGFFKKILYSFNYVMRPKKRFFYELEAYEVQFRDILSTEGNIPRSDRLFYARIMSSVTYMRPVTFEYALREVDKVCDKMEKE